MYPLDLSNHNLLHLIQRNLVAGAIIKLSRFWRFVVGDLLGVLDGAAVLEVGGNAGGPEGMIANVSGQADCLGTPFDHPPGVDAVHRPGGHAAVPVDGAEEGGFLLSGDACRRDVGIQAILGVVVSGHLVPLAAFLVQTEPSPPAFGVIILDLHAEGGGNPGETEHHDGDQCPVVGRSGWVGGGRPLPRSALGQS
jgi:hypothetical protein